MQQSKAFVFDGLEDFDLVGTRHNFVIIVTSLHRTVERSVRLIGLPLTGRSGFVSLQVFIRLRRRKK